MSVPEGKMSLDLHRDEVWLVAMALQPLMSGRQPSQALLSLARHPLNKMLDYLEAIDGPSTL